MTKIPNSPCPAHPAGTASHWIAAACAALIAGCGGGGSSDALPQLAAATGAPLGACADLASKFSFANTTITSAAPVAEGPLPAATATVVAGPVVGAHCQVKGEMYRRTSPQDGSSYAIGFEMRMPNNWNGRFFYQANGGLDGNVGTALGAIGGSAPNFSNALKMGFAVISSNAGHDTAGPSFGIDAQARLDYGYNAAAKLTPMAKSLITSAYGKGPDRSYFGGCSNGGRHTFVATTRLPEQYDGFLAGAPGYRLPLAATANMFSAKQLLKVPGTTVADLSVAFPTPERVMVSKAILAKCDALDGATDGIVQDVAACQKAFDFNRDVPTCSGARDGTCLSADQKTALAPIFSGATDSTGKKFYASLVYDAGISGASFATWKFNASKGLDTGAVATVWGVPPISQTGFDGPTYLTSTSVDTMLASIAATNSTYLESALSFMQPVNPSNLSTLKNRGAKVMVYHGVSDPIFMHDDTVTWYENLRSANNGNASDFARFYPVPGMGHCAGGPATDQFDMLTPLVNWVEKGQAPDSVVATARGLATTAGAANLDIPTSWTPGRTRPLCPYPQVARLKAGATDLESASSFSCQ
ncbi:MAG TPA: tannase/feruloyl esterase family alpha/beta hydrolase [Burkholderiaceae bacterium]|nr:tannase/feruloyl esterase family alpha/beta hydrolase [Burkholderiaceae bacterium]